MFGLWRYYFFVFCLSLCCLADDLKMESACEVTNMAGQLVTIRKWKYRNCICRNKNTSSPSWLLNNGRGSSIIQALVLNKDVGEHQVRIDSSTCINLSILPLNSSDPRQFRCNLRWPTLAAIILDVDLTTLDTRQRITLWNSLKSNIKGAAGLRLLEDVTSFEKSIFVLASGLGNSEGKMKNKGVAVVWQIGCGSVELKHLKTLQWLEKSCLIGEFSELIGGYPVEMWLVADLYDREKIRRIKREALWQRNKINTPVRPTDRIRDSMFSGSLLEGSGIPDINTGSGDKMKLSKFKNSSIIPRIPQATTTIKPGPSTPSLPVVRRNLNKVSLTIRQINNFKIPRETFYDPQQGYSPALKILVFYVMPVSDKQIEIVHNDSNWISYDKDLQNIRFLPIPGQIGAHKLLLCAFDKDDNKVCEPLPVDVGPSAPIVKITVLQIPAGALWTYEMPSHWLDGLTFNSTSDLTFTVEGDAIFCWDESKSMIQVVTEAVESRILKIIFNVVNAKEYQTLKYEFTLAVSDVSPISNVMSDTIQMRLRWTGPNLYPLYSIKTFLNDFASVIKSENVDSGIDPEDLLIYRVLHHRDFKIIYRDTSPDDILTLQIVFKPSRNSTCERAALTRLLPAIKSRQSLSYFYIDSITIIRLKGRCNHAQVPTTTQRTTSLIKSTPKKHVTEISNKPPVFFPKRLLEDTYDVRAGAAFLIYINVKEAINDKLVRYLSLLDYENKNVTDSNWLGLSTNGTSIYGMPLKQHVQKESYKFWIVLYTVTAHVLKAQVSIFVKPSIWTTQQINHIIRLKLKLTETLTDESIEKQKINSLKFRIKLTQEIGKVLKSNCKLNCAMDIVVFDIKIIQKSLLLLEWSHMPVLDTDGDLREVGLQCPWNNLIYLFKSINGISNYPIGPQTIQQVPAQTLSEGLQNAQIGTVVGLSIERLGPCAVQISGEYSNKPKIDLLHNITAFCGQGFRVPIKNVRGEKSSQSLHAYAQLYYETDIAVPKTHWISVSASQQFIYGLPMLIHSTSRREYVLQLFPQNGHKIKSQFIVTVLPNPFQSSIINHEITMRMAFISHSNLDDNIINGLDLRWKVAAALDSYIRPECTVTTAAFIIPECAWRLDVIIFEIGKVESSLVLFDIKWSLRSLLQLTKSRRERQLNLIRIKRQVNCPENQILHLKRLLFGENHNGPEPLQKLQTHLRANAGVKLNTIHFQRRGRCTLNTPNPGPTNRLIKTPSQDDSQKMFLITTVIPVCAFTICILFVALMIALCMKKRNYSGYMKASQNNQLGPGSPVILPDEIDRSSYPPSKPLILPHEKPPLPPPDYNHDSSTSFVPMTSCSYRSPSQTMSKMTNGLELAPSTFGRQQTPSIRSSPHSHDRFPHGVYN